MGMYNCFTNEELKRVDYTYKFNRSYLKYDATRATDNFKFQIKTDNTDYKYYSIPVKFNEEYTIAMNCESKIELACILYNDIFISSTPDELIEQSYMSVNNIKINKPISYSTLFDCAEDLWTKEKDLRLILKIPSSIETSITILEGNYMPCINVVDGDFVANVVVDATNLSNKYYSKNSLLYIDDNEIHPFADRLVEYLLGNVITNMDNNSSNVERVQDALSNDHRSDWLNYGLWDEKMTKEIYDMYLKPDMTRGSYRYGNNVHKYNLIGDKISNSEKIDYILYAPNLLDDEGSRKDLNKGESYTLVEGDELCIYYYSTEKSYTTEFDFEALEWKESESVKTIVREQIYKSEDNICCILTNDTGESLNNSGSVPGSGPAEEQRKELPKGYISIDKSEIRTEPKRFIDSYSDLYGYVDKDVESLLRLL